MRGIPFLRFTMQPFVRERIRRGRRRTQKGCVVSGLCSSVRSSHERDCESMERAGSRVDPDYTINRITADRAEPRIK